MYLQISDDWVNGVFTAYTLKKTKQNKKNSWLRLGNDCGQKN